MDNANSAAAEPQERGTPGARGSIVYGVLDLLFAGLYLYVFLALVPSRSASFTVIAVLVSLLWAAGGVGMLSHRRWGRRLALVAALVLLGCCIVLLLLLLSSAAYLHGIYGGVGQAGVVAALIVAALVLEAVGLLPVLQLAFLWRTRS